MAEVPSLQCQEIDRSFGGLKALKGISLVIAPGQIFGLVGPNGSGKTTLVNAITGFYPPQRGRILYRGARHHRHAKPHRVARLGIARTFQNLALFRGMSVLDNILMGRHIYMRPSALATFFYWWWAERDEIAQRRVVEEIIDFLQLEACPRRADRRGAARPAEARRARPRACGRAAPTHPGRADGRHEPGREGIHGALHPRRPRGARHHRPADRASHGRGRQHLRPHGGAELWRADRRRRAAQTCSADPRVVAAYLGKTARHAA